jgi:hypothetical protein
MGLIPFLIVLIVLFGGVQDCCVRAWSGEHSCRLLPESDPYFVVA